MSSELLTQLHKMYFNTEVLALKSVHDIQTPVCSFLIQLSSTDCIMILKNKFDNSLNQPSMEKILLNYLITDYISCGLSFPGFYTVFHKTLQSNKSKEKLLKDLITIWDCLFKVYKITSLNVEFIKHFIVKLESLFINIIISINNIDIKCEYNIVMNRINYNIKVAEQNILGIENIVSKKSSELELNQDQKLIQIIVKHSNQKQNTENRGCMPSKNKKQADNFDKFHQKKKLKLSNVEQNVLHENINLDSNSSTIQSSEPKLNAFQIMMLNAKKQYNCKINN